MISLFFFVHASINGVLDEIHSISGKMYVDSHLISSNQSSGVQDKLKLKFLLSDILQCLK